MIIWNGMGIEADFASLSLFVSLKGLHMTEQEIISRIDELSKPARERMDAAPHNPLLVYAEVMWMTQEEATELLELRLALPSAGEQRRAASLHIAEKIAKRKSKKAIDNG